ncbi:hypothetical protein GCM10027425_10000 [Alteromonas gracilis]
MTHPSASWRLPNGLQVQLFPDARYGRVGVCTTFGVGMRDETPGWEGVAHLVEHLLFEGSAQVPQGQLRRTTHDAGGVVNGTTHLDYTDYYQAVPGELLERVLHAEADRFAAPLLEPALATQLDVVEAEIDQTSRAWPMGDLPWPVLPMSIHTRHANRHDGYGRPERLRRVGPEECRSFFEHHYSPRRAVLSVLGDFDEERTAAWIEEYFGAIPARPAAARPDLEEPLQERWRRWEEPLLTTPVALWGFALPDPVEKPRDYAAALVVRELVASARIHPDLVISASAGVFGPYDARDPDLLVIMAAGGGQAPEPSPSLARQVLAEAARRGLDAIEEARGRAVRRLGEARSGLVAEVRELSRCQAVFGRHDVADHGASVLAEVSHAEVLSVLDSLHEQPLRGATVRPSERRRRPVDPQIARVDLAPRVTGEPIRSTRPIAPSPSLSPSGPAPATPRRVPLPEIATADRPWGRVVAVRETRADEVGIGLRVPLGDPGWQVGEHILEATAQAIAHALTAAGPADHVARVHSGGQWLDIDLTCRPADVTATVERLWDVLERGATEVGRPASPRWDGTEILEHVLRLHWGPAPGADATVAAVVAGLRVDAAVTVIVGPIDPELVLARLEHIDGPVRIPPLADLSIPSPGRFHLPAPRKASVDVLLAFPELDVDPGAETSRFLAAAATAGYRGSRLGRRVKSHGDGYGFVFGRGRVRDRPVSIIRAAVDGERVDAVAADLAALVTLAAEDLTAQEIDRARAYCRWQSRQLFDSPSILATTLRTMLARSLPADWPWRMAEAMDEASTRDVRRGALELFGQGSFVVSWGTDPGPFAHWPPAPPMDGESDV